MSYIHVSKPGCVEAYKVRFMASGLCIVVDDGGREVLRTHDRTEAQNRAQAENAAALERAKVRVRPCMCCSKPFPSEGAHNRLCNTCRRADGDPMGDSQRPYLSRKANG